MENIAAKKLLYFAVEHNFTTKEKAEKAGRYAAEKQCGVSRALLDTGAVNRGELLDLLGKYHGMKVAKSLTGLKIDNALISCFETSQLERLKMLPFAKVASAKTSGAVFKVLVSNPINTLPIEDYIREVVPDADKIEFYLTHESELSARLPRRLNIASASGMNDFNNTAYDITNSDTSDIVALVNKICLEAVRLNASDIHIQPHETDVVIRFRLDGMLTEWSRIKRAAQSSLINRVKTMGNMDINNSMLPQNGRIRLSLGKGENNMGGGVIDIRVSATPTIYGEKLVLRLLNNTYQEISIDTIDLSDNNKDRLLQLIKKTSGIILVTGPTGSGKSTTSYACLSLLNDPALCVITLEDPVERKIEGLVQCEVNQAIGLSFLSLLEETLRQDPDVILIGEIREEAVARIAVQASNTGHLVFSTLHTNTAASAVTRLIEMGVEPYMVSSTLNAVLNQRLVRKICPSCKIEYTPEYLPNGFTEGVKLYKGAGCASCGKTGFSGRLAVHELLVVNDDIRSAIKNGVTAKAIDGIAVKNGMKTIYEDATEKVLQGLTTPEEVRRVLG